jgi:ComF family protein
MSILKSIYRVILEALFPISPEEREVLAMDPKRAWETLPRAKNLPIDDACSLFSYKDQRTRKLIWCIKYKKSEHGAEIAAYSLIRLIACYSKAASPIIIVPMPITKKRRRERGYNQCELIAERLEKLNCNKSFRISNSILSRKVHLSRQTMKGRQDRLESAKDIFVANINAIEKLQIDQSKKYLVLVIDDVITTGSTIIDAINTLRRAGLKMTFGVSVAH